MNRREEAMKNRSRTILALAAITIASAGPAAAITGGVPDGGGHPFVGWMYGETPQGAQTVGCSGVLVSPTVFLTSGVCTESFLGALVPNGNVANVWLTFDPNNPVVPGGFDPPTTPPSVLVTSLVTNPAFLAAGGSSTASAPGNVGVAILDTPQAGPFADLPVAGRLDALTGTEVFTAVAYGTERNSNISTLQRRFSGADFRSVGADDLLLRLTEGGGGPPACIGSQNEAGGGFIGASEAVGVIVEVSSGCTRNATFQRLDVTNVRDFLDDYVTLP